MQRQKESSGLAMVLVIFCIVAASFANAGAKDNPPDTTHARSKHKTAHHAKPGKKLSDAKRGRIALAYAKRQLGKPYEWGAEGPATFDCSGLTMRAWQHAGRGIPRTAAAQYAATERISMSEVQPGDLVFFRSSGPSGWHVAMVVNRNKMLEGPRTGLNVRIVKMRTSRFVGAGRPRG